MKKTFGLVLAFLMMIGSRQVAGQAGHRGGHDSYLYEHCQPITMPEWDPPVLKVKFDHNSRWLVGQQTEHTLSEAVSRVRWLADQFPDKKVSVEIEGHTSAVQLRPVNGPLSRARAWEVQKVLERSLGNDSNRVHFCANGFGSAQASPAENHKDSEEREYRFVTITICLEGHCPNKINGTCLNSPPKAGLHFFDGGPRCEPEGDGDKCPSSPVDHKIELQYMEDPNISFFIINDNKRHTCVHLPGNSGGPCGSGFHSTGTESVIGSVKRADTKPTSASLEPSWSGWLSCPSGRLLPKTPQPPPDSAAPGSSSSPPSAQTAPAEGEPPAWVKKCTPTTDSLADPGDAQVLNSFGLTSRTLPFPKGVHAALTWARTGSPANNMPGPIAIDGFLSSGTVYNDVISNAHSAGQQIMTNMKAQYPWQPRYTAAQEARLPQSQSHLYAAAVILWALPIVPQCTLVDKHGSESVLRTAADVELPESPTRTPSLEACWVPNASDPPICSGAVVHGGKIATALLPVPGDPTKDPTKGWLLWRVRFITIPHETSDMWSVTRPIHAACLKKGIELAPHSTEERWQMIETEQIECQTLPGTTVDLQLTEPKLDNLVRDFALGRNIEKHLAGQVGSQGLILTTAEYQEKTPLDTGHLKYVFPELDMVKGHGPWWSNASAPSAPPNHSTASRDALASPPGTYKTSTSPLDQAAAIRTSLRWSNSAWEAEVPWWAEAYRRAKGLQGDDDLLAAALLARPKGQKLSLSEIKKQVLHQLHKRSWKNLEIHCFDFRKTFSSGFNNISQGHHMVFVPYTLDGGASRVVCQISTSPPALKPSLPTENSAGGYPAAGAVVGEVPQ